jgi:hypothetical protein
VSFSNKLNRNRQQNIKRQILFKEKRKEGKEKRIDEDNWGMRPSSIKSKRKEGKDNIWNTILRNEMNSKKI